MFRPRSYLLLAFACIGGCDTQPAKSPEASEPIQITPPQKGSAPPATHPVEPVVADCGERPPADMPCSDPSAACRDANVAWARAWKAFTLKCEPIRPANPIAGEAIEAIIPHPPGGAGECMAGEMKVTRVEQGDTTLLKVDNGTHGYCEDLGSLAVVDLGLLEAGHYELDTGYFRTSFDVRKVGSDPGALAETMIVAMAVAEKQEVGRCFGMPGPDQELPYGKPFEQQRIANQLKKAYPGVALELLQRRYRSASAMVVREIAKDRWTYAYTDGGCCTISQVEGEVRRRANGTFEVGAARVVSSEDVPC